MNFWPTFLFLFPTVVAAFDASICPKNGGLVSIAGTSAVARLSQAWKEAFDKADTNRFPRCPNVDFHIQPDSWPAGAARVCDIHPLYSAVDIAGMSGGFFPPQAISDNGWSYDCQFDSSRKAKMIHMGHEGVSAFTGDGTAAHECIQKLGGISLHQLRWMLSSYTIQELDYEGVDVGVEIPFSDGDDSTHRWSELNENCTQEEIHVVHVASQVGVLEYLNEFVLTGQEEQIGLDRIAFLATDLYDLAEHISTSGTAFAVAYLADTLSDAFQDPEHQTQPVSIRGVGGEMLHPSAEHIEGDAYPLASDIFMGVWDDPVSLRLTKPFLGYGLSEEGAKVMQEAGFWPVHQWEMIVMETRLQTANGVNLQEIQKSCGPANQGIRMAGSVEAMTVAKIWSEMYLLGCSVDIEVEGGGNSAGAGRVCANEVKGDPVDIGMMSREWNNEEGAAHLGYVYACLEGDTSLSAIQVVVAYDREGNGIYMNLLNNEESLKNTIPLLKFGYRHPDLVTATGLVPVGGETLQEMLRRLRGVDVGTSNFEGGDNDDDDDDGLSTVMLVLISAMGGLFLWFGSVCLRRFM